MNRRIASNVINVDRRMQRLRCGALITRRANTRFAPTDDTRNAIAGVRRCIASNVINDDIEIVGAILVIARDVAH